MKECLRFNWTSLKKETCNSNTVNGCNFDAWFTISGNKGGKTKTQENSVFIVNFDGVFEMVVSWLENNMKTEIKLSIDGSCRVFFIGNVYINEINLI